MASNGHSGWDDVLECGTEAVLAGQAESGWLPLGGGAGWPLPSPQVRGNPWHPDNHAGEMSAVARPGARAHVPSRLRASRRGRRGRPDASGPRPREAGARRSPVSRARAVRVRLDGRGGDAAVPAGAVVHAAPGRLVVLTGGLGAGKTTFAKLTPPPLASTRS